MPSAKGQRAVARVAGRGQHGLGMHISITGIPEMGRELQAIPGRLARLALKKAMKKGGGEVSDLAEAYAPRGATGNLKASLSVRARDEQITRGVVGADVFAKRRKGLGGYYAHLVEYGHDIYRTTRTGKYFIKHYGGQRFMLPAIKQKEQRVIQITINEVKQSLERYYGGYKTI